MTFSFCQRLSSAATIVLLAASAPLASAQVLHDNGAQIGAGIGLSSPLADDFQLSSPSTLVSFDWYVHDYGALNPATISANYFWRVFADAAGVPGSLVGSGTVTGGVGTLIGGIAEDDGIYLLSASFNSLTLGPGTYWLSIAGYADSYPSTHGGYWAASQLEGNAASLFAGSWEPAPRELAFTIYGTQSTAVTASPEPRSTTLLATGLVGLFGAVRRRRGRRTA